MPTPTFPRRSSRGWPSSAGSASRCPRSTAGSPTGGESDYMGMVVATEELSWGSLGVGGSLITRPEILTRALVYGGTEEQKKQWLPKLASAEILAAVAVTEPDYGSDVAGIVTSATAVDGGWVINGVKTWCTFAARADVLMLLARTDPDRSLAHRGHLHVRGREARAVMAMASSSRRVPRTRRIAPRDLAPGKLEGRPIDTLGYRGHALVRVGLRELVRARGQPCRRDRRAGQGLLPPDAGLRERPAADGGACARCDAGGLRGGFGLRSRTRACSARPSATTS